MPNPTTSALLRTSASPAPAEKRAAEIAILLPLCEATGRFAATVLNAHHRVRGELTISLHPWLGKFYEAVNGFGDDLNERVEAIGGTAPVQPAGESMPRDGMEICRALHERLSTLLDEMSTARERAADGKFFDLHNLLDETIRPLTKPWGWTLSAMIDDGEEEEEEPASKRPAGLFKEAGESKGGKRDRLARFGSEGKDITIGKDGVLEV